MTAKALSLEDELEVAVRYGKGLTTRQLAERFGTSEAAIRRALDRAGVQRRPAGYARAYPEGATLTIVRMRRDGASWAQIATAVGMAPSGVRRRYESACRSSAGA